MENSPFIEREDIIVITDADAETVDPSQPTLFIDVEVVDNDDDKEPEVKTSVFEAYLKRKKVTMMKLLLRVNLFSQALMMTNQTEKLTFQKTLKSFSRMKTN